MGHANHAGSSHCTGPGMKPIGPPCFFLIARRTLRLHRGLLRSVLGGAHHEVVFAFRLRYCRPAHPAWLRPMACTAFEFVTPTPEAGRKVACVPAVIVQPTPQESNSSTSFALE